MAGKIRSYLTNIQQSVLEISSDNLLGSQGISGTHTTFTIQISVI